MHVTVHASLRRAVSGLQAGTRSARLLAAFHVDRAVIAVHNRVGAVIHHHAFRADWIDGDLRNGQQVCGRLFAALYP